MCSRSDFSNVFTPPVVNDIIEAIVTLSDQPDSLNLSTCSQWVALSWVEWGISTKRQQQSWVIQTLWNKIDLFFHVQTISMCKSIPQSWPYCNSPTEADKIFSVHEFKSAKSRKSRGDWPNDCSMTECMNIRCLNFQETSLASCQNIWGHLSEGWTLLEQSPQWAHSRPPARFPGSSSIL